MPTIPASTYAPEPAVDSVRASNDPAEVGCLSAARRLNGLLSRQRQVGQMRDLENFALRK